ncbi:hypothetical protein F5Y12DRAFT_342091 [Xylaria sp. FL1777]|nr:hypothetical protein F5Y12DRAFT_342091 [Xylaria sp. FL1777]
MYSSTGSDWISQLPTELLLKIFKYDLTSATLLGCMLCCKRWERLVTSVLYKHVALISMQKLSRWIAAGPSSSDAAIETLTIRLANRCTEYGESVYAATMNQLRLDLDQLPTRLQQMVKLQSLSIAAPDYYEFGQGDWTPFLSMAKILDNVPESCSSLELVIKHSSRLTRYAFPGKRETHVCVSIRRLIPQLRALRLALPCLCPESFGRVLNRSSTGTPQFAAVGAPKLQECIIRLATSVGFGGIIERFDGPCNSDVSLFGVKAFAECLLALTASGQAPLLQKLWIRDALSKGDNPMSYESFVRRDILTNKSYTFPWKVVCLPHKAKNFILVRMPAEEGDQDLFTTVQGVKDIVEGYAWVTATNGTRLPATVLAKYQLPRHDCLPQTRAEWSASSKISTVLWENERKTGTRLIHAETGELLEDRPAHFRIPVGWRRGPVGLDLERIS